MEEKEFKDLLDRYSRGACTEAEVQLLESWYITDGFKRSSNRKSYDIPSIKQEIWNKLSERAKWDKPFGATKRKKFWWPEFSIAASLVLVVGLCFYFYNNTSLQSDEVTSAHQELVLPGSNKATLYLADGSSVDLEDSRSEELLAQAGLTVSKLENGQLVYKMLKTEQHPNNSANLVFHSIKTPRGGQYQVILEDGTRVWLNAESILRYPVVFGAQIREVELQGEAYFEVQKDKKRSFIVKAGEQRIEALGTAFNVNAYKDRSSNGTTLVEGSIALSLVEYDHIVVLKPGQQAKLVNNVFSVKDVDVEEAISWKNGYFLFEKEKLESALEKISRWYDLQVIYKIQVPSVEINGSVSKFDNIEKVLEVLHMTTALNFNIEGRRLIVSK